MLINDLAPGPSEKNLSPDTLVSCGPDDRPSLRQLIDLTGSIVLHFTRQDKYAGLDDGPRVRLGLGANWFEFAVKPNDTVSQYRIIE